MSVAAHPDDVADALALAPFVARDYHGGQFTAMYAYASSGTVTPGLAREAAAAVIIAEGLAEAADAAGDYTELYALATDAEALRAIVLVYGEE
jgi:glycine/D-amino acid oxidase-like deaminating enzyme